MKKDVQIQVVGSNVCCRNLEGKLGMRLKLKLFVRGKQGGVNLLQCMYNSPLPLLSSWIWLAGRQVVDQVLVNGIPLLLPRGWGCEVGASLCIL